MAASNRMASRTRLLMRFLRTARPNARGTVKPILGPCKSLFANKKAVKSGPENREP